MMYTGSFKAPFVMLPEFGKRTKTQRQRNKSYHGMPWKKSVANNADCVYMPFWEWQLSYMEEHLTNFKVDSLPNPSMEYVTTADGTHRMVTLVGSSEEYRFIRMTYMDGGKSSQVFTSVCYPRGNHPILGIDLLQFGGKRHLTIVDFLSLGVHDAEYEHLLEPTRQAFPSLREKMSSRFYDPDRYFSKQTLLGRFQSTDTIKQELWPAYQAYFKTHVDLMKQSTKSSSTLSEAKILKRHSEYDTYVASRDPAHPMFKSLFGSVFANEYLYQVLFPLADPEAAEED